MHPGWFRIISIKINKLAQSKNLRRIKSKRISKTKKNWIRATKIGKKEIVRIVKIKIWEKNPKVFKDVIRSKKRKWIKNSNKITIIKKRIYDPNTINPKPSHKTNNI